MNYLLRFKSKRKELLWTFVCTCLLLGLALMTFLYNRYIIYVKNLEAAHINLTNHLNYTYKDKFFGLPNINYDVNTNTYQASVDFYLPNEEYTFNLSSRGHVMGDGYLHNNKDNLLSFRFARQLKDSLVNDFKDEFPEIFKVYTEMQILNGKYDYMSFYNKEILEPHVVHIYIHTKKPLSKKSFLNKVDKIGKFLVEKGYKNLNNVHVNYVVRKEAPPLYYSPINFSKYLDSEKAKQF